MARFTENEIIQNAENRGLNNDEMFDPFCLISFVENYGNENKSLDDIIDEFEDMIGY